LCYKFPVRHRKGRDYVVPDALSRIPESDIAEIVDAGPQINLESAHFSDEDYQLLKKRVRSNQNCLPDLKIVDEFVYARREHASGNTEQENTYIHQQLRLELIVFVPKGTHHDHTQQIKQ